MSRIRTIACVDYDHDARTKLKLQLEAAGYTIVAAGTLSYALAIVGGIILDAILLNDMLPDPDAHEIVNRLRQANRRAHIIAFSHRAATIDDTIPALAT